MPIISLNIRELLRRGCAWSPRVTGVIISRRLKSFPWETKGSQLAKIVSSQARSRINRWTGDWIVFVRDPISSRGFDTYKHVESTRKRSVISLSNAVKFQQIASLQSNPCFLERLTYGRQPFGAILYDWRTMVFITGAIIQRAIRMNGNRLLRSRNQKAPISAECSGNPTSVNRVFSVFNLAGDR